MALLQRLWDPTSGRITFDRKNDSDEKMVVGRADYQWTTNHSVFGRYMATMFEHPAAFAKQPDNVLTTPDGKPLYRQQVYFYSVAAHDLPKAVNYSPIIARAVADKGCVDSCTAETTFSCP